MFIPKACIFTPYLFLFQKLVKTGENNWSLPELVHAVVLLAHYHALASFVFGSGINPERDPDASNGVRLIAVNNFCVCDLANDNSIENASLRSSSFGVSVARECCCLFPRNLLMQSTHILSCLKFSVVWLLCLLLQCQGNGGIKNFNFSLQCNRFQNCLILTAVLNSNEF